MQPWIQTAAARRPERVAIETPDARLTYAELADAAARAAGALGVRPGARVAVALAPGLDFVIALHGCLIAGAAIVPIDLRLSDTEQKHRRAGAEVWVDEALAGQPTNPRGEE